MAERVSLREAASWARVAGKADPKRWEALKDLLSEASTPVRMAVVAEVIRLELADGRRAMQRAEREEESFKAELVRQNMAGVERFADRLTDKLELARGFVRVAVQAVSFIESTESEVDVLRSLLGQLQAVGGPWRDTWPGREAGAGLSGYDTPEAVKKFLENARQVHANFTAHQNRSEGSERPSAPASPPPRPGQAAARLFNP